MSVHLTNTVSNLQAKKRESKGFLVLRDLTEEEHGVSPAGISSGGA